MSQKPDSLPEPAPSRELFADFANTLEFERGQAVDAISAPGDLLSWLVERGLISERLRGAEATRFRRDGAEAQRRLERFRELRRVLHAIARRTSVGRSPTRQQIRELNHILRHGLHYHQLRPTGDGARYAVAQIGDWLDQARAAIASSLAHFLAEGAPDRLRVCANEGCRYVFVDHSPTGRRRWCDMRTCGNQAKVARHRARAKARA
ncbi:MAG: CGNR zinc finger domain-containing protein [Candidatus Limnocylindria bacterium]